MSGTFQYDLEKDNVKAEAGKQARAPVLWLQQEARP